MAEDPQAGTPRAWESHAAESTAVESYAADPYTAESEAADPQTGDAGAMEQITKDTINAEIRGLTVVLCAGAEQDCNPWCLNSSIDEGKNMELAASDDDPECEILRRTAQILPRLPEEVVAVGLSDLKLSEDKGAYRLYARNSIRPESSDRSNRISIDEEVEPLLKILENCDGGEAVKLVCTMLGRCTAPSKCNTSTSYSIDAEKLSFRNHVWIFTALLNNPGKKDLDLLATAFYIYTTQISQHLHRRRFKKNPTFTNFFTGDPPSSQYWQEPAVIRLPGFLEGPGSGLMNVLKAQIDRLEHYEDKDGLIKKSINKLLDELTTTRKNGSSNTLVQLSARMVLTDAVHRILGFHIRKFNSLVAEEEPKRNQRRNLGSHLIWTQEAYMQLMYLVNKIDPLIKAYMCWVDNNPATTSNIKSTPALETANRQVPVADPDDPIYSNEPTNDKSHTNSWGTCALQWLSNVVTQGSAVAWLWARRQKHRYDIRPEIIDQPAPEETFTLWEQQSQLKELLADNDVFDNISTILRHQRKNPHTDKFDGTIHAEVIIAAALIARNATKIWLGISRRPCYVCFLVLQEITKESSLSLRCRPARSSHLVWKVSLPTNLTLSILRRSQREFFEGAVRKFTSHGVPIRSIAQETGYHKSRLRNSSASTVGSQPDNDDTVLASNSSKADNFLPVDEQD